MLDEHFLWFVFVAMADDLKLWHYVTLIVRRAL
jgi:hypothetical protein